MSDPGFVTRFAPSPTGPLHLGHAFSALTAFDAARRRHGRFLLRIEDIDSVRCRPVFETAIAEDLAWLGLAWEAPVRRQSEHLEDYSTALASLHERGLTYRCFKTRREVLDDIGRAPHAAVEAFTGGPLSAAAEARRLGGGEAYAWRLSMAAALGELGHASLLTFFEEGEGPGGETGRVAAQPGRFGDVILARKGLGVAYHLAVVVDDALQGVTHVIRGSDLFEATNVQCLIQALLGLPTPTYRHHRMLTDACGRRLSKRDGAASLRELRAGGATPAKVRAELGIDLPSAGLGIRTKPSVGAARGQ